MTLLRIPAVCWCRGTPRRARTENTVPAWFVVPLEIPDVRGDQIDGRILVRDVEKDEEFDLPVLGGRPMRPVVHGDEEGTLRPVDAALFEKLVDGIHGNRRIFRHAFANLTDASSKFSLDDLDGISREEDVVAMFREIAWTTRPEAEAAAVAAAADMAVIDGVVHEALTEPVHVYDLKAGTRKTEWRRLSSWSDDRGGAVVARCDRVATDGGPFDEGFAIEGDVDAVRWRFRDRDANALQIARLFFEDDHLAEYASFQNRILAVAGCAAGVLDGRPDAADMLVETVEELLSPALSEKRRTRTPDVKSDHLRSLTRLSRSIRNAEDSDRRVRLRF